MLSGKDIYNAGSAGDTAAWDDLDFIQSSFYELVAARLNTSHIAPLQTLVKDFVALLEDPDLMIEDSTDGWWAKREAALALAKQLLGEKP